jgi:HK97 family phage prohead protease
MEQYDFSGWATRNNLKCSDGRVIMKDAFKHNDGQTVPLVWNHQHNDPMNVLGHAKLENREEGVYAYGSFNGTEAGVEAKKLVQHGDISGLSIYANQLKQQGANVFHGAIREVSLVLAGANPGAFIDSVMVHNAGAGEETEEDAIIYSGENIELSHAVESIEEAKPEAKVADSKPEDTETIADVFNTLSDKQKTLVYALVGEAIGGGNNDSQQKKDEEEPEMKHNLFDKEPEETKETKENVISHSDMQAVITDAKRFGSLRESAIAHGITDIDWLFPEAKNLNTPPDFIKREMGWVSDVMSSIHHTPFSRIKSMFADLTEADARAKGYTKGKLKIEEVFGLLKRSTTPTTIYKKQKLDRDDVVDITDFDVVAWLKSEMRMMLDEEIARAILVGDGRNGASDDKINETCIRPIWTDADLYTIKHPIQVAVGATAAVKAEAIIDESIRSRINYKGSGNPVFYTTEAQLTEMLLLKDMNKRALYDSVDKLATALRVRKIVTAPVMENLTRVDGQHTKTLVGLIVNLADYNVGADKGGAVNMFDDFDIDYNAQKYLIETRCSGALIKPYSAIALEMYEA